MKLLPTVLSLLLLSALAVPQPALAECYQCKLWMSCDASGCWESRTCEAITSYCTQCWVNCRDTMDSGCYMSSYCQWSFLSPASESPSTTLALLQLPD